MIIMFLLGMIAGGGLVAIYYTFRTTAGTLKIDHSNPEKDVYRFEIDDLDKISSKKCIELRIDHNAVLAENSEPVMK